MRKSLVFAMVAVLVCSSLTLAGVPDPSRSGCGMSLPGGTCIPPWNTNGMYRFAAQGTADKLTIKLTLRDAFDTPVASCSTSVVLSSSTIGTKENASLPFKAFCACPLQAVPGAGGPRIKGATNASGIVDLVISKVGGHGSLTGAVTAHCVGNIAICTKTVEYTSPDMLASCEAHPTSSTTVADLGAWAASLPPMAAVLNRFGDYTCGGGVGVGDLGFWAANGLAKGCN